MRRKIKIERHGCRGFLIETVHKITDLAVHNRLAHAAAETPDVAEELETDHT